ncbi:MAG: hypothetical protein NTY96_08945 [Bacteroidetes bacterium]|nr:hypothetical protein [Bacteroidota bacterium]
MKKVTLFIGMLAMVAFFSTSVVAQDKAATAKPAATQTTPKADAKTPASCTKKDGAAKEGCKPGCTMHKDKCCDKDKKATAAPEKK